MGVSIHKVRFMLLAAALLSVFSGTLFLEQVEVRGAGSMFGQSVSRPDHTEYHG
jgi:hypothetical protein